MRTELIEKSVMNGQGVLNPSGALMVKTGKKTGRSTKERFVVKSASITDKINWGKVNQPLDENLGQLFFSRVEKYLSDHQKHDMQGYVGAFQVEVLSTSPWHIAFATNMFRRSFIKSLKDQIPDATKIRIFHLPDTKVSELGVDGFPYDTGIVLDPAGLRVAIVGTGYAGEIKKSAFALCNYLLPNYGIMPMHASANCNKDGSNSSVLFGLSGTGKTTLSADPNRHLIGDDEIIWSDHGLSNLEGGCYAKLIDLDCEREPDIFNAVHRFGSILENVVFSDETREIDFVDGSITENTRGSYSIDALSAVFDQTRESAAPKTLIYLTADAFGALPAVSRLDSWQAQYHFASGYTAKVAGTEMGVTEPTATFSACFGAPFMPRPVGVYSSLLAEAAKKHDVTIWMLNTGWIRGYGKSDRFPIDVSRQILTAIQQGELNQVPMVKHPVFGFEVPTSIPGVAAEWLQIPEGPEVLDLAKKFQANAEILGDSLSTEVKDKGGPRIMH